MKDLEKQIERAAHKCAQELPQLMVNRTECFIKGAKSPEAKKYWQHDMLSKGEMENIVKYTISQWISGKERNEPDHKDLVDSFIVNDLQEYIAQNKE